ncbi:MAG: hypothetical protein AAB427_13575, partial [Chloroflexota bacterium]
MSFLPQRILIFTPVFPKMNKGASEQDQIYGALGLQAMGHTVRMAAFLPEYQTEDQIQAYASTIGLDVVTCPYPPVSLSLQEMISRFRAVLRRPVFLDGSAYQHTAPIIQQFAREQIVSFRPSIVWLDNNFLWPLAELPRDKNIPLIIRSQNFEPRHLLD